MTRTPYKDGADELKRRILALIPDNPKILRLESVWDLLDVPGFKCDDLQPTHTQAAAALAAARSEWRAKGRPAGGGA